MARPFKPASTAPIALASASLVVMLAAFVYGVLPASEPRVSAGRHHVTALFLDADGLPRLDLVVVDAQGRDLRPDDHGILGLPTADNVRNFEVLEGSTRRWLRSFTLHRGSAGVVRIVVRRP